jgi:CHASE2 domain-containing sensor protein
MLKKKKRKMRTGEVHVWIHVWMWAVMSFVVAWRKRRGGAWWHGVGCV